MELIGHEAWQNFFKQAVVAGSMHHAYLVTGTAHTGKTTLTQWVIGQLLRVAPEKILTHPDLHWVERLVDEKTGKTKKEISIDQARLANQFTHGSAFYCDGWRVVVIREADRMSRGAANALLKTLEEPGTKTVLFLLAENETVVMPTIRSRCQQIRLRPVADTVLAAAVPGATPAMLAVAAGRPGLLVTWQNEPALWQTTHEAITQWATDRQLVLAKQWAGLEAWCAAAPEDSRAYYQTWLDTGWQALHLALAGQITMSAELVNTLATALRLAERAIRHNVTPRLALEQVCLAATGHYRV